jgi:hypothetical protein
LRKILKSAPARIHLGFRLPALTSPLVEILAALRADPSAVRAAQWTVGKARQKILSHHSPSVQLAIFISEYAQVLKIHIFLCLILTWQRALRNKALFDIDLQGLYILSSTPRASQINLGLHFAGDRQLTLTRTDKAQIHLHRANRIEPFEGKRLAYMQLLGSTGILHYVRYIDIHRKPTFKPYFTP